MVGTSCSFASQPALSLGLAGWLGDAHAAISYPHAAGGSRPDHVLMDVDLLPEALQSKVDVSCRESDHFPLLTLFRCQPSARPSTIDTANGGRPLPRLSWASGCRESYVERLDASKPQHTRLHAACTKWSAGGVMPAAFSHPGAVCCLSWLSVQACCSCSSALQGATQGSQAIF